MKKVVSVREARSNFHNLLKMVKAKEDIIVENQETGDKFRIISFEEKPKKNKRSILKKISAVNLKSTGIGDLRKVLSSRLDDKTTVF